MEFQNIFKPVPEVLKEELIEKIAAGENVRIERIVSRGHSSPEGFYYDQEENEWVILLKGEAKLTFENTEEPLHLKPGDYVNIPSHKRHRVEWTPPDADTVWLAVFY